MKPQVVLEIPYPCLRVGVKDAGWFNWNVPEVTKGKLQLSYRGTLIADLELRCATFDIAKSVVTPKSEYGCP